MIKTHRIKTHYGTVGRAEHPSQTPRLHRHFRASLALSLLVTLFTFVGSTIVQAAPVPAHLVIGGRDVPFEVTPFVGDGGVVFAPVDFVRLLGADYKINDTNTIITAPNGKVIEQKCFFVRGRAVVPVEPVATALGANTSWDDAQKTFSLHARLLMARVDGDAFVIATSYPVYYQTQVCDEPARLVVDIHGADLNAAAAAIPMAGDNVTRIRSGQLDPDTVRIVLDLRRPINFQVASTLQTSVIKLALNTNRTRTAFVPAVGKQPVLTGIPSAAAALASASGTNVPTHTPPVVPPLSSEPREGSTGSSAPDGTVPLPPLGQTATNTSPDADTASNQGQKIVDISYKAVDKYVSQVVVTTQGHPAANAPAYHAQFVDAPKRLAIDFPGAALSLADAAASLLQVDCPLFSAVRWGVLPGSGPQVSRVVLDLSHPIIYTVATEPLSDNSGTRYIINIQPAVTESPRAERSGSIAGKIIVVDAGHGGHDSGAPGRRGIYEKNLNLAIAKIVRDTLIADGAKVIMTRADDTFIPLPVRSQMGVDAHADYFISIHCDSSGIHNGRTGSTVYFHASNIVCRSLARAIDSRLAQADDGIAPDGVKSDYNRFPGIGYAVLRNSPEPSVLVECGYVDNDHDVSLLGDADTEKQMAQAIVAGLRDFVGSR